MNWFRTFGPPDIHSDILGRMAQGAEVVRSRIPLAA